MSSALASKTETKWKNENLKTTLEVSNEVTAEFPEAKEFIEERLEQKCGKKNISVKEVIYIFPSLEAELVKKNIFYFVVLGFKAETF